MRTPLSSQFTPEQIRATGAKFIARNTSRRIESGAEVIRLHATDIVRIRKGDKVRLALNSGGYRTMVTKDRINAAINPHGFTVFSGRDGWRVGRGSGWHCDGPSVPFYDGMTLPAALDKPTVKGEKAARAERKLKAEIKAFADKLDSEVPLPDAGDCFLCAFERAKIVPDTSRESFHGRAQTLPAPNEGADHLREHIREGYMHGSLILNALLFHGYTEEGARMFFSGAYRGDRRDIARLKQCLRRYLGKRLGLTVKG